MSPFASSPQAPRRVLLTGAAGFIGARLAGELLREGWRVLGVDDFSGSWPERLPGHPAFEFRELDVSEPAALARLVQEEGPFDDLVHLAARVGVRAVLRDPEGCRRSNLKGVEEVLRAVEAHPEGLRPRVLFASSSEVYAERRGPSREGDPTRPPQAPGRWAYAASKLLGEERLAASAHLWSPGRGPLFLRFFNVVGPGQDAESGMVLPTFVERALAGQSLPVHGSGEQVRTFAHVEQVARVLRALLERRELPGGPLNVGGVAKTTIGDLARCVGRCAASASRPESCDPRRAQGANFEGIEYREPDLGRLAALGVPVPSASLEEIVADSLAHHANHARPAPRAADPAPCASPAS